MMSQHNDQTCSFGKSTPMDTPVSSPASTSATDSCSFCLSARVPCSAQCPWLAEMRLPEATQPQALPGWQHIAVKQKIQIPASPPPNSAWDFSQPLRLPKRNFDVPTLNQLAQPEKLHLLRSCGYQVEKEYLGYSPVACIKLAELRFGKCKYFTYLKCLHVNRAINRRKLRDERITAHIERQSEWYSGGRTAAYYKKYRFGRLDDLHHHVRIERRTGMSMPLSMDVPSAPLLVVEEDVEEVPTPVRPQLVRRFDSARSDEAQAFIGPYWTPPLPERNVNLLKKLRLFIRELRLRTYASIRREYFPDTPVWVKASPEMDGPNGEELSVIKTENVVLTEENPSARAMATRNQFRFDWHQLCSTEKTVDYSNLTDRWTLCKSFNWTKNHLTNSPIPESYIALPGDFVKSVSADGSMPMFAPFKFHKYYKSDIEIKIHINSNKFQVGQLQFSWQYMERYDGNTFENIYSRSQLPHVLVNAGASNETTLYIPYAHMLPYLQTSQRKGSYDCMYLGDLRCFVVSALATGAHGPDSCGITIYIRFPKCQFTGMRDGNIAEPQMEGAAAAMIAGAMYNKMIGDVNCDNPSNVASPPYLVPTASHSWSYGTGTVERLHSLRLDGNSLGVGRPGIANSETSIGIPCRTFCMLEHFEWTTLDASKNQHGAQLYSIDVHPQVEKSKCFKMTDTAYLPKYAYPSVGVVAGLYKHWRGSLEYRFDIIASMFHTGRLLVAYIPGFYGDSHDITINQARNSPHVEFSLQDATSFTFTVPYIANTVWWSRRYTGPHKYNEQTAPSKLVVFVLNPLVVMESVVSSVKIVPYIRAGEDFEVSVPVQPSCGLSDNCAVTIALKDFIFPTTGSYPYYCTNYEGFGDDKYYIFYEGTAVLGTACTFTPPARSLKPNEYFYGKAEQPNKQPTMIYTPFTPTEQGNKNAYVGYIVLWGTAQGNYGIPFPNNAEGETQAKTVAYYLHKRKPVDEVLKNCYKYISDGNKSSVNISDLRFKPVINTSSVASEASSSGSDFTFAEMEDRYDAPNNLMPTTALPSTSSGGMMFNENFSDLKDLMRRYQLYLDRNVSLNSNYKSSDSLMLFPILPYGLTLDVDSPDSVFNTSRDGHIPLILNSYIFFRGSIRIKIVFSSDDFALLGGKIWVQHHPDGECPSDFKLQIYPNITEEDNFKSHGYGFYIQALNVNSIVELEIPFYQPGMYGLLRKPRMYFNNDICKYHSLGNVVVGLNIGKLSKKVDMNVQVYYSIGDDFSANIYRGFAPVVFTDEVWTSNFSHKKEKPKRRHKPIVQIAYPEMMAEEVAEPEMFSAFMNAVGAGIVSSATATATSAVITSKISQAREAISGDIAASVATEIKKPLAVIQDTLQDTASRISDVATSTISTAALTSAVGNLIHIAANPTPKTIAISVVNVIASLLSASVSFIFEMVKLITELFTKYWNRFMGVAEESANLTAEPEADDPVSQNISNSVGALVFTAVSALFAGSGVVKGPGAYCNVMRGVFTTVGLANNVVTLLKNSGDLITYCVKYISIKLYPKHQLELTLLNDAPEIKIWFDECIFLLDARSKDRFVYDRSMLSRVFDASVIGQILVSSGIDKYSPSGKVIWDIFKDIRKLQNDLIERGAHPDVRFEPFPIWLTGSPGIGKSYLVTELINRCLRSVEFRQPGSLIYYIPAGAKYWSGCMHPAALVSDDLFQVKGTRLEEELANIFAICSSSVLNPPMAAVEDKERRLNPLVYMMLCNQAFPELSDVSRCTEAVYRRRKFLIEARLRPDLLETYPDFVDASDLPAEERINFKHLEFRTAKNVKIPSVSDDAYSSWFNYDRLLEIVLPKFKDHYINERANFKKRMHYMYCLDPNFDEHNLITDMPVLENTLSLKEQIEAVKDNIRRKLDEFEDPMRQDDVSWNYISKFRAKVAALWNAPQAPPSFNVVGDSNYMESNMSLNPSDAEKIRNLDAPSVLKMISNVIEGGNTHMVTSMVNSNMSTVYVLRSSIDEVKQWDLLSDSSFRYIVDSKKFPNISGFDVFNEESPFFILNRCLTGKLSASLPIEELQNTVHHIKCAARIMAGRDDAWVPGYLMNEMLRLSDLDIVDILRMCACHKVGMKYIARLLFPKKDKVVFDPSRFHLLIEELINGKDPRDAMDELLAQGVMNTEVWDKYHKSSVEKWLASAMEIGPRLALANFLRYCVEGIVTECADIFEHSNLADTDFFINLVPKDIERCSSGKIYFTYLTVLDELFAGIKSRHLNESMLKFSADVNTERLYKLAFKLLGIIISAMNIYGTSDVDCAKGLRYKMCMRKNANVKYCVHTDKLILSGDHLEYCTHACVFNNKIFLTFISVLNAQCTKRYMSYTPSPSAGNGAVDYELHNRAFDFYDFSRILANRRRVVSRHWLTEWLKKIECFTFNFLPKMANYILTFIKSTLPVVLFFVKLYLLAYIGKRVAVGIAAACGFDISTNPLMPATPQANYFKFDQPKIAAKPNNHVAPKAFAAPQGGIQNRVQVGKLVENNAVFLYCTYVVDGKDKRCLNVRCLMLAGRSMLVLRHYFEELDALYNLPNVTNFEVSFVYGNNGTVASAKLNYLDIRNNIAWCSAVETALTSNFGICILPKSIRMFKNIIYKFATYAEHKNVSSLCDFYSVNGDSQFSMPITVQKKLDILATSSSKSVFCDRVYSYQKQSRGFCGSILVCPSLCGGSGGIVGMHVAGNGVTGNGFAEPLYREMFEDFFNNYPETVDIEIPLEPIEKAEFTFDTNVMMYGTVPAAFAHKESGKSKIIPSLLHGSVFPVKTEINPLRPNDPRQPPGSHPLRDGCAKHGKSDVKPFASALVSLVSASLSDTMQQVVKPVRAEVRPLSLEQAICGDVNVPYFEALNWKSSEGFPLSSERPREARDKRWLFELGEGKFGYELKSLHPSLSKQLAMRDHCFKTNVKPPTIYIDCLKDYRLTPEKCKIPGKTRIFSVAPIQCSIDIRMYLNDFCASLKNSRIKNGIGIGINPDSLEWTQLVTYLHEVGSNIITLDYSNYGPCLMSQLVSASNEVIVNWFSYNNASAEHVARVQWLLDCDILNPVHLSGNLVYQTVNGISSGSPLTGECNSLPNLFYIRLTYLEIMFDHFPTFASMYHFNQFVRLVVYGDDLIMAVHDDIKDIFNGVTIQNYLSKHGIVVTSAQKGDTLRPYTTILDATFLKRSFRPHPTRQGVWLAPVDEQSITECINWVHDSGDPQEALLEVCRASLDLSFGHGPVFYSNHYEKIKRALSNLNLTINVPSWYDRDVEIFGDPSERRNLTSFKIKYPWYYDMAKIEI